MSRRRKVRNSTRLNAIIWNVAAYIRLSKEDGNDESNSVKNQRAILQNYLDDREDLALHDWYTDDGMTGTGEEGRPAYQRMLQDVKAGTVNCVIVKDLSRAFRNSADQTRFLEETCIRYNIRFISIKLPFVDSYKHPETLNALMLGFQGLINENHCRETSAKVREVFDTKRQNGEFIGAFAPYGYQKSPDNHNRLIVDEEAAQTVKDIFTWFVQEGMSKNGIAKKLNDMKVPNPATYKRQNGFNYNNPHNKFKESFWMGTTIKRLLSSQIYLGHMVQGKQRVKSYKVHDRICTDESEWFIVENTHEPIIEQNIFNAAQDLQERETRTAPNEKKVHMFSGFVRCSDCGKSMNRKTAKNTVYYGCRNYGCTKHAIREDKMQEAVLAAIKAHVYLIFSLADTIAEISSKANTGGRSIRLEAMYQNRQKELEKSRGINDSLYIDMKSGLIDQGEYKRLKAKMAQDIQELEMAIKSLEEERKDLAIGVKSDHPYFEHFKRLHDISALDRSIVVEAIDQISIHEGGDITIRFRFEDQLKRIIEYIDNNNKELTVIHRKLA